MLGRELREPRGTTAETPPGRRRAAASSSARGSPGDRASQAPSSSGATPDFDASPERLTSSSAGTVSRRAADSESSEWTSSQMPFTTFDLVRLQVADEVPAERVAVDGVLRGQVLRAVLAHYLDARLREDREVVDRDVLRRGDDGDARAGFRPDALVALAHRGRVQRQPCARQVEQSRLSVVRRRVVDDDVEQPGERSAELRAFDVADRDQVAAVDREIARADAALSRSCSISALELVEVLVLPAARRASRRGRRACARRAVVRARARATRGSAARRARRSARRAGTRGRRRAGDTSCRSAFG